MESRASSIRFVTWWRWRDREEEICNNKKVIYSRVNFHFYVIDESHALFPFPFPLSLSIFLIASISVCFVHTNFSITHLIIKNAQRRSAHAQLRAAESTRSAEENIKESNKKNNEKNPAAKLYSKHIFSMLFSLCSFAMSALTKARGKKWCTHTYRGQSYRFLNRKLCTIIYVISREHQNCVI